MSHVNAYTAVRAILAVNQWELFSPPSHTRGFVMLESLHTSPPDPTCQIWWLVATPKGGRGGLERRIKLYPCMGYFFVLFFIFSVPRSCCMRIYLVRNLLIFSCILSKGVPVWASVIRGARHVPNSPFHKLSIRCCYR